MYVLIDIVRETVSVFVKTAPYLLFGFFLAGVLKVVIPARWLSGALGKSDLRSAFRATMVGIPLPLCSCSVVPWGVAMREGGASKGSTVSFLVSTPETGVDSISVTYALMDPIMTVARPVAAFGTAMAAGVAVNVATRAERAIAGPRAETASADPLAETSPTETPPGAATARAEAAAEVRDPHDAAGGTLQRIFAYAYGQLMNDIVPWLVVGLVLTGVISAIIPAGALSNPALQGFPSMLAMLVIGIPLYVCATASTPIAAALMMKGLSPGAAMVFLLVGPATNAAAISVLLKILGRRTVFIYLLAVASVSLVAGGIVNGIYQASGVDAVAIVGQAGEVMPAWLEIPAAFVLLALVIRSAAHVRLGRRYRDELAKLGRPLGMDFGSRAVVRIFIAVILVLYLLTGVSVVNPGEVGWVMTFGKITRTVSEPGLVVHWPYPFARTEKERPALVRMIDLGYRQGKPEPNSFEFLGTRDEAREITKETEVATGDENILAVRYSVQYRIDDPYTYHFALQNGDTLVSSFAEYAIRRVVSVQETDSLLVNHRIEIETLVADRLTQELDRIAAGIDILRVDLIDVHAPPEVHPAFRDVASAMEDQHRSALQAESDRNQIIASARGRAYTTIVAAERDKMLRVAESQGRAQGFASLEAASRDHREITRLRFYLDAASKHLPKARIIIPLVDLPIDLWIKQHPDVGTWPEPIGENGSRPSVASGDRGVARAPNDSARTPSMSLMERLERFRENER